MALSLRNKPTNMPPAGLFITGTDTEIGKTYVAALIAAQLRSEGHRIGVYKPVASGCEIRDEELISGDAQSLWDSAGRPLSPREVCPQKFVAPLAPHLAARAEGKRVDVLLLSHGAQAWRDQCDILLVEGAGGLMSPLAEEDFTNADLATALGFPLLLVAPNRLGTLHGVLATELAAMVRCPAIPLRGIVLNDAAPSADASVGSNAEEIARRSQAGLLATVAWGKGFRSHVDWRSLAG